MTDSLESIGYRLPSEHGEFMEPDITMAELWYVVETGNGTEIFPVWAMADVSLEIKGDGTFPETDWDDIPEDAQRTIKGWFIECDIDSVEIQKGFGYRLSASGYMDCTDWGLAETEAEAKAELQSMYPEAFLVDVYKVTFVAHCGMRTLDRYFRDDERQDARKLVADTIRKLKRTEHSVSRFVGSSDQMLWESMEPEACAMVPDTAGILTLETLSAYPLGD